MTRQHILQTYLELSSSAMTAGNEHIARMLMQAAEEESRALDKHVDVVAGKYLELGNSFRNEGQYTKAVAQYLRAATVYEASSVPQNAQLLPIYDGLAEMYFLIGKPEKSLRYYRRALGLAQLKHGKEHQSLRLRFRKLAWLNSNLGRMAEAEDCLRKMVAIPAN